MEATLTIKKQAHRVYQPIVDHIVVKSMRGKVVMVIGSAQVLFSTLVAHGAGLALIKEAATALPGDLIIMEVNSTEIQFLPRQATQIGAALLRKVDVADDWQLANQKPKRTG